jgi:hypothetical protein
MIALGELSVPSYKPSTFRPDIEEDQAHRFHYSAEYPVIVVYPGHQVWIRLLSIP